jgi:pyruvate formate lyase activating enzyme
VTSQALRDPEAVAGWQAVTPEQIADASERHGAAAVVSTYNEPLITAEWAVAVFRKARERGLLTGFVSNGNATPQVLEYIRPWVDLYKVDLKGFDDRKYRQLGGRLQPILDSIRRIHEMGFWLEVVTLLVPGFNDSEDELRRIAGFMVSVSPDVPWHVTAFHPDYKMTGTDATPRALVLRAAALGREAGLRYVYGGNIWPGDHVENTYCPQCGLCLVERRGFRVLSNRLAKSGPCPGCGHSIPGLW